MRKLLGGLVFLLTSTISFGQDFSNKGKEFYLCFPTHVHNSPANLATLSIYITSDKASSGTITMANGAFSGTFSVAANGLQEIQIPWSALRHISNAEANSVIKKSIKITVNPGMPAVVAYAQQWAGARSAATLLLPVSVLGKKYYATSFTQTPGGDNNGVLSRSQFQVIAIKNNTVVSITPRKNGILEPSITVTLPLAGDMYEYQSLDGNAAGQDLTGTYIESIASGAGGCSPIAVFSGSSNVTFGSINCTQGNSYDPLWQQMYPVSTWGKNFGFIPTQGYRWGNPYRVLASENNTSVYFNGVLTATINAGEIYPAAFTNTPVLLDAPTSISADKPISVIQYLQRNACSGPSASTQGDPDMVVLNPIEQNISDISIFSSTNQAITQQYVNVLTKTNSTNSFLVNGAPIDPTRGAWAAAPNIPGYSFIRYSLAGFSAVRLQGDSGFNAIAYGYGANESYAYSAGTYIRDLSKQLGVNSQYGIESGPSTCTGEPFEFKACFPAFNSNGTPYIIDSMVWKSSNVGAMTPGDLPRKIINPPIDSTRIVNGKQVNWYHLPGQYSFNAPGTYLITITNFTSGSDACGAEEDFEFELEVSNPPVADFSFSSNGCEGQPVQFTDLTTANKPTYRWWWDFGDPASGAANTSALQNPVHTFSGPGTYNVRYSTITTPGCVSDTIPHTVVISALPQAVISGDAIACQNQASPNVVFTGSLGTAPYTFTYNINNGPAQTITTTAGNSISLPVPTATPGTYNYYLVSVSDNGGVAGCARNTPDTVRMIVNPLPTATITGSVSVCRNATAPVITFTAAGGSVAPYTFSYNINAGPVQTISTVAGNSVTLTVPTATAGTFVYNLVSVRDAGAGACTQVQSGSATVTVNPLPTATITGTTAVCLNGTAPVVTFTGAGSTAPYIFTYTLNGGPQQTVTSTGNTATVTVPTTTAGTFIYSLVNVRDGSGTTCLQAQTGTATVTVHPLPTPAFNFSAPGCINSTVTFTDISTANVGTVNNWSWNFGDPSSGAANTSALQNPTHSFAGIGTYQVSLTVTNSEGCVSAVITRPVTISNLPTAAFTIPEVCLLDPLAQFTDISTAISPDVIAGWNWNFGDPGSGANNTSTVQNGQHAYSAVGNYTVTLTVTTNNGCTHIIPQVLTVNGGNPVSNFIQLNPTTSCSSDTVSIQNKSTIASGTITKVDIYWDNSGQPAVFETDQNPVFDKIYKHKYPTSTSTIDYNVRFRAYSGGVCVNDRILPVRVLATPDVSIANIPDQCYTATPLILNFGTEAGGVVGTTTYSGPGVSFAGGNWIFNSTASGIGDFEIRYKFTATAGGCVDSTSTMVKVLDTASARFTLQGPACEKNAVTFNEQSTAPASVTLANTVWDFGDGTAPQTLPVGGTVSHVYANAGTFTVTMYTISATGCRSTVRSQPVVIGPRPSPNFSFPASLCLPAATAIFTNSSSIADGTENLFTYLWDFGHPASGASNSSTLEDPTHIYTGAGPYNVKLQVTSGAGCVHDTTIVVNTIHPQPKADFSISRTAICVGDNVGFTSLSNGGDGTITSWNWNFDDGSAPSTNAAPTHLYGAADTYNVRHFITNSFGCNSDTVSKPFKVYAPPTVDAGPDVYVLEGGTGTLEPVYTGEDNIYLWSPSDYLNSTGIARPVTKPLADITYKIRVTNPGGCSDSSEVKVILLKGPNIPNTFSPNGDGINDRWIIEYLDTYPNCKVLVFTRAGQKVFESRGYKVPWNGTINGKSLPLDTYYYIIEPENGRKPVTGYITIIK